jgi:RNA recognition motif-containing protein
MPNPRLISHNTRSEGINVFVGNLPLGMTEAELTHEFTPFGEITSANIMNDKYIGSGQSRGYGYVAMAVRAQGEAAIAGLNGKTLQHHIVNVLEAMALTPVKGPASLSRHHRERSQVQKEIKEN